MDDRQCFEILELDVHATLAAVKQAYRDLMRIWHPDRYAHSYRLQKKAEEKTKEINAAYERVKKILSERENCDSGMRNHTGRGSGGYSSSTDEEKGGRVDSDLRQETWARAEARLAEIAKNKRVADNRRTNFARMEANERVKKKPSHPETGEKTGNKQNHSVEKNVAEKKYARKKKEEKERRNVWLAAEEKLRKLADAKAENLNRLQTIAEEKMKADTASSEKQLILIRPVPLVIFCCTVILLFFFAGIAQNYTRLNIFLLIILAITIFFVSYIPVKLKKRKITKFSLWAIAAICAVVVLVCIALFSLSSNPAMIAMNAVQAIFILK